MAEKETKKAETKSKKKKAKKAKQYDVEEFPTISLPSRGYFVRFDKGTNVETLQVVMNRMAEAHIKVTGIYDDDTMEAVELFEERFECGVPNGMFGKDELEKYNKLRGVK